MADMIATIGRPPVTVQFGENTAEAIRQRQLVEELLLNSNFLLVAADLALGVASKIGIVATNMPAVLAVEANAANINALAPIVAQIATVAGIAAAVEITAANAGAIADVATDLALGGASLILQAIDAATDAIAAASTVGLETRNPASRGALGGMDADDGFSLRAVLWASAPGKSIIANQFETALRAQHRYTGDGVGDSRMQGSGVVSAGAAVNSRSGINGSFPRHLEYRLQQRNMDWRIINRGVSGQKTNEIAARSGAIPILITLTVGTTLPSAGATACRASPGHPTTSNGPSALRNNSPDVYAGFIGAQACLLKAVDNNSTGPKQYTIEQVGGTGDLTVLPGTIFRLSDTNLNYAVKLIWAGVNDPIDLYNVGDGLGLQMSKDAARAIVDALPVAERRYVHIGDTAFCGGTMDAGSAMHNKMLALNAWKRDQFGDNFFDFHKWGRGEAPYDGSMYPSYFQMANISPTDPTNDWVTPGDWVTLGRHPRRLVSIFKGGADVNHPHEDAYFWTGAAVDELHFKAKGWQP